MINLSSVHFPSAHVTARAKLMWATKYDSGEHTLSYKVVPFGKDFNHKSKDRRLVLFDLKRRVAECLSLEDGSVCNANYYRNLCSHVLRAHQVMEKANKRKKAA